MFDPRVFCAFRNAIAGGIAVILMHELASLAGLAIAVVPFACSIILLLCLPDSDSAQPRSVVGGHVLCALSGCVAAFLMGPSWLSVSTGIGLAMLAMELSRTVHPPAGLTALIAATHAKTWDFVFVPVLSGAAILVLLCFFYYRAFGHSRWPKTWL